MSKDVTDKPSSGWVQYLDRLRDTPDKWLFVVVFALGTLVIASLKALGAGEAVTVAIPVALLLFYAIAAMWTRKFRLREDRIAENCYYLGLLFTLVSLAFALYAFTTDPQATQAIIANFGVALTTTIVGVALRVVISQLREDPVEYEREARMALSEATSRLTGELRSSVEDFASFRRGLIQMFEETTAEIVAKTNAALASNATAIATFGQKTIARLEESYSGFKESSLRQNQVSERALAAMETLITRVQTIDVSPEVLSRKLDPMVDGFRTLLSEASERAAAQRAEFNRVSRMTGAAGDATARLEQLVLAIESTLRSTTDQLRTELQGGASAVAEMRQGVSDLAASVARDVALLRETATAVRQTLDADVHAVRQLRSDMESETATANDMVRRLHTALIELADRITESVSVRV